MRATTFLALFGAAMLVAACTNDVNLGDGDAGDGGGAAGNAGGTTGGTSGQAGAAGTSTGGKGGTAGSAGVGGTGGAGGCPQGYADCDGNKANGCEANLWTDPTNCGACALVCLSGSSCSSGKCSGDVDAGGCGNGQPCPAGQVCLADQCVADEDAGDAPACVYPWVQCQNGCKDLENDTLNCGACGQVCAGGQVCAAGACTVDQDGGPCGAGWADCDGNSSNGCETNVYSNELNCGMCAQVCAGGQICAAGVCTSDQDGGDAPFCANTSECGAGEICVNNTCVPDGDAGDAGPASCDPFTNTGCSSPYACVVGIPYYSESDIYCFPSGNTPADAACSPQALCAPGTTCVHEDPYGNGHCRKFCDFGGGVHGCPSGETCKSVLHPTIGICAP